MASAVNLSLKNAAAAAVVYYPTRIRGGETAEYVDRTNSVIATQSKFTLGYKQTATVRHVSGKLTYPVASAPGVVDTCIAEFKFVLPLVMDGASRAEILARTKAAIADAIVDASVTNGETPY